MSTQLELHDFFEVTVREAFQNAWLMDQLLAVSAAHWNWEAGRTQPIGLNEASVLQTKALAQFNATELQVGAERFAPTYLFSILVAFHVMFEALSSRAPFPAFLDPLVQWFNICRGIAHLVGTSTGTEPSMGPPLLLSGELQAGHEDLDLCMIDEYLSLKIGACGHFADLMRLVEVAGLDGPTAAASKKAIDWLHQIYYDQISPRASSTRQVLLVLKWPIVAGQEYVQLVERRCPESLVILAHYAVLLYHTRYYWTVGDSGAFIIQSITQYLGPKWESWLVWPNEMIKASQQSIIPV
ncbi:hypothetical protein GQ53DRAFT_646393 [Thozetella sp. PMI_491]|nr:hypothetical protein GQ53DRAFT_646393 [Thozetella sp. PMI_491]